MPRRHTPERTRVPPVVAAFQAAQTALDLANRRVKELEFVCETLNQQLGEPDDRADAAELLIWQSQMQDEGGQVALGERAATGAKRASRPHRRAH